VNTHPGCSPRYKKRGAAPAELPAESPVDPDPLAHRNFPGEFHVPVAQFRVRGKCRPGLQKEYGDPLAGYFFCLRGAGTLSHG
jgi:hypothetical protein